MVKATFFSLVRSHIHSHLIPLSELCIATLFFQMITYIYFWPAKSARNWIFISNRREYTREVEGAWININQIYFCQFSTSQVLKRVFSSLIVCNSFAEKIYIVDIKLDFPMLDAEGFQMKNMKYASFDSVTISTLNIPKQVTRPTNASNEANIC